jgi:hypothetical protein
MYVLKNGSHQRIEEKEERWQQSAVDLFNYTEELHRLYSSPSIIRMIKSRRMR